MSEPLVSVNGGVLDNPIRIGIGATALFTLAGSGAALSWWISAPIMVACAIVAVWGFWPLIRQTSFMHISLRDATIKYLRALKGTDLGQQMELGARASNDDKLDFAAAYFLERALLEVWRPLIEKWEPLGQLEAINLIPRGGAMVLANEDGDVIHPKVRLKRSIASRLIREQKTKALQL